MTMFPTWTIERLAYWIFFALIVLSIERVGIKMDWNIFQISARSEKVITALTLLGIAVLLVWAIFSWMNLFS